jgi:general secretion pathway protein G
MVTPMTPRRKGQRGFTLLELMIVVAILGILTAVAIPRFQQAPQKAKEAVLKANLHTMREAFDQYFADKAAYPESLEVLVEEGYLREVPIDPLTGSSSTWQLIYAEEEQMDTGLEDLDGISSGPGIWDVKSGANHTALDGTNVADW